jgi:hypothetical protein
LLAEFKNEATMHNYEIRDRFLLLEPKEKERLGHNVDIFDAVIMGDEQWLAANTAGGAVPSVGAAMRVCVDRGTQGL